MTVSSFLSFIQSLVNKPIQSNKTFLLPVSFSSSPPGIKKLKLRGSCTPAVALVPCLIYLCEMATIIFPLLMYMSHSSMTQMHTLLRTARNIFNTQIYEYERVPLCWRWVFQMLLSNNKSPNNQHFLQSCVQAHLLES